ncbi:MAG: hypothetical protein AUH42_07055 [Gemmatimonadetes bacterium 13_1_40CM_70_11]|nr:MAG: hypothetical protein AUH42_07055 [Gemmatimonadetes bacterium 13_1_40CM_70_11]
MTVARNTPDPEAVARGRLPPAERPSGGVNEPLAGVQSSLVSIATRRVARQLRAEPGDATDPEIVSSLLAAIALAVDRRHPDYVSALLPQPSAGLGQRLVEMLRAELLKGWADGSSTTPPSVVLDALTALEQVRQALERSREQSLGEGFTGADARDLFLDVVHDLRSPLTSILCLADTLQRGQSGAVNQLQQRQIGLIYSAALGLSGMVSDALELARGGDDLADNDPSPFSLYELLHSIADIVQPMAVEKGLWIRLHPVEPDRRIGHPVALSRILLNLTTNALKFTDRGGVDIACAARGPATLEFSVRDTGPGINPLALENLFQPFRRARGGNGYCFSGTGLGLAISRKLITTLGSRLDLETDSSGTRFYFTLDVPVLPMQ